jgi:hypothetical protein
MPLTDNARLELERRGPTNIRLLLISWNLLASGKGAHVPIDLGAEHPLLGDVEAWSAKKERDEGRRANGMLWGAVVAAVARSWQPSLRFLPRLRVRFSYCTSPIDVFPTYGPADKRVHLTGKRELAGNG